MKPWRSCAYCDAIADTRDHILPRSWGNFGAIDPRIRTCRPSCARCNNLRAVAGHCPGAMASLRATLRADAEGREEIRLAALWGWCGARAQMRVVMRLGFGHHLQRIRAEFPPMEFPAEMLKPRSHHA